ncbi:MAG: helix-turn-helix transcriptional regulator [Acholeplasmatales bacterium]|mgnify:FL=1|jgi:transcriptional regulator with XRE-family HTH domain|nr:helix-turn-helix transcriptional regulator [Acholeplasmatales bacterium]MCI9653429.1 helix-turn-helix transcriptional regulator [Acholeplasmatales bacterium]
MSELRKIIGKNLSELRKRKKYTQQELGEILLYSDKTISKWEKGESLPGIEILCSLCDLYGITLDYLTHEGSYEEKKEFHKQDKSKINKIMITLLSISLIWFLILISYVYPYVMIHINLWILFIWGLPASWFLLLIFNRIWGKRKYKFAILSLFLWSFLTAVFLLLLFMNQSYQVWAIFLLGIPAQIAIILWSQIKRF